MILPRQILVCVLLAVLTGCNRHELRWPASPAMTFGGAWCADGIGAAGYERMWTARSDGYCYEDDAPSVKQTVTETKPASEQK